MIYEMTYENVRYRRTSYDYSIRIEWEFCGKNFVGLKGWYSIFIPEKYKELETKYQRQKKLERICKES